MYIHARPMSVSFQGEGYLGYTFGPLHEKDVEILYIESEKGHDSFIISKRVTRIYYVISGTGRFTIADNHYSVSAGMLVEIPTQMEYSYSGHMTLLALCTPRWSQGNEIFTRWNPDVVSFDSTSVVAEPSYLKRLVSMRILGKSPTNAFLRFNKRLWNIVPPSVTSLRPLDSYGHFLHKLAQIQGGRAQGFSNVFLRNQPHKKLIDRAQDS